MERFTTGNTGACEYTPLWRRTTTGARPEVCGWDLLCVADGVSMESAGSNRYLLWVNGASALSGMGKRGNISEVVEKRSGTVR